MTTHPKTNTNMVIFEGKISFSISQNDWEKVAAKDDLLKKIGHHCEHAFNEGWWMATDHMDVDGITIQLKTNISSSTRQEMMNAIARGNIERNLGMDLDGDSSDDQIYDEAYTLALDALIDAGIPLEDAREIAIEQAQLHAQP